MHVDYALLKEKGWTPEEIEKTGRIIESIERAHHATNKRHHNLLYVLVVFCVLVGNLFFAIFLIPLFSTLDIISLLIIIGILGIIYGLIFALLINDLEKLEPIHQYSATLIVAATAFINFYIVVRFSQELFVLPGFHNSNSPLIVGIIYTLAFIMPYANQLVKQRSAHATH
ncbi:MAG: hypothetical protein V1725_03010 [archaeon]